MAEDFDAKIADLEKGLQDLKEKMSEARELWLDALAPKIAAFWRTSVEKLVTDQADHANALGLEGLRRLKSDIEKMAGNAREIAERRLVGEHSELWPDLAPQTEPHDRAFGGFGPGSGFALPDFYFEEKFGPVEGPDVLKERIQELGRAIESPLRERDFKVDRGYGKPLTPPFIWDRELASAINAYAELHDEYVNALQEMTSVNRKKTRTEAQDLWNQA